jgi:hypothetical protein
VDEHFASHKRRPQQPPSPQQQQQAASADEARFEHPGLTEAELVEMLAADAARYRLPELLRPEVAQLLFDAQYFAPECDLPEHMRQWADGAGALAGEQRGATAFVTLPAALAPFTTLVQTGRTTPSFRFVDDLGPDAHYLTPRELETVRRRARRAAVGDEVGFDPDAARRAIARNRQRRFQGKRAGEFVVIDTSGKGGRKSAMPPGGRVRVHEKGSARAGTPAEEDEAHRYLGYGKRRPHRLRFS